MTHPAPLYTPANMTPRFRLYWIVDLFWHEFVDSSFWLSQLTQALKPHDIRLLRHRPTGRSASQFLLRTPPNLSPQSAVRFLKGNLQTLLRPRLPNAFRRNYAFRSLGSSRRTVVERYIASQLPHHRFVDPRFEEFLSRFQINNSGVDLSVPRKTEHSMYWYNLHVVLVNAERFRERRPERLSVLTEWIPRICQARNYALSSAGILPDHIHLALGVDSDHAPINVALCVMNNLAYKLGMKPVFQHGCFVGTFGEYDLGALDDRPIIAPPR